ncbi:hypothetical protein Ptc2401_01413 [Prosthecochloris sp. CIB 2401]|nr:hypothetical protein Ptc2401_01413 [Prosthecochloris sp. CIB 2401]
MSGFAKAEQVRPAVSMTEKNKQLSRFGFSFERGGAHSSRTMMLKDLGTLLTYVDRPEAEKSDYFQAIDDENCLGKRSGKTRTLTYRHLVDLYSLDRANVLFRALLYFWNRDIEAQPLLALICTFARDPIFRSTAPFILKFPEGAMITRESLEEFIDAQEPGRFSKATLKSTAQNINSTWTKSGHLYGHARKVRSRANPTAGSVSYALLLGYLSGVRGQSLFQTEYTKLLDCTFDKAVELAEEASRKGWIVFKRVGDVIEGLFPNLINQEEMEWLREQS